MIQRLLIAILMLMLTSCNQAPHASSVDNTMVTDMNAAADEMDRYADNMSAPMADGAMESGSEPVDEMAAEDMVEMGDTATNAMVGGTNAALPAFPWPLPQPSARAPVERALLGSAATLDDVDRRLTHALDTAGYGDTGRFSIPSGFLLLTRMERFQPDGRSWAALGRFILNDRPVLRFANGFNLSDYIRALLVAQPGHYRVLAFVVTDRPILTSATPMTAEQASARVMEGADRLDERLERTRFLPRYRVTMLVYEFIRRGGASPKTVTPGSLVGAAHLKASGVTRGFAGAR